jgi:hypothetical protein
MPLASGWTDIEFGLFPAAEGEEVRGKVGALACSNWLDELLAGSRRWSRSHDWPQDRLAVSVAVNLDAVLQPQRRRRWSPRLRPRMTTRPT